MTISKARELLGLEIADLSDDQVLEMIVRDSAMLDALMDLFDSLTKEGRRTHNGTNAEESDNIH